MRLWTKGRLVVLDFETAVTLILEQQFSRPDVARAAAMCIASILGLEEVETMSVVYDREWAPKVIPVRERKSNYPMSPRERGRRVKAGKLRAKEKRHGS